jgi:hypothetical protein
MILALLQLILILAEGLDSFFKFWLDDNQHLLQDPSTRITWFDKCPFAKVRTIITTGTPYWITYVIESQVSYLTRPYIA